ncbi:MAG: YfhO family protein, partial [Armatimonadota bacterium]|nr:YfhO family protein [Armatimonadota bacterium]
MPAQTSPSTPLSSDQKDSSSRRRIRVLWGLAGLCALAYVPALLSVFFGAYPFTADGPSAVVPWREFASHALWRGVLPLWNPHLFCGIPFMNNGQSTILYPPSLVYWLLPFRGALLLDALLHNVLLAWGGYALARALNLSRTASCVVAIALALGGSVSAHFFTGHVTWHTARAYLPWELWALLCYLRTGQRRYAFALAGFVVLQIASGYPPLVLLSAGLCCGLIIAWIVTQRRKNDSMMPRGWPSTALSVGVLVIALSAVYVLPLREAGRMSAHGSGLPYEIAVKFPANWRSLVRLITPTFFGNNDEVQWSHEFLPQDEAAYVGLLPLVLALGAPFWARRRTAVPWLWALLPVAVVLALGNNTPVYRWLFDHFALLRMTRIPVRWLELWYLAAALLAGFSFDQCIHRARADMTGLRALRLVLAAVAALFFTAAIVLLMTSPRSSLWISTAQWNVPRQGVAQVQAAADLRSTAIVSALVTAVLASLSALLVGKLSGSTGQQRRRLEISLVALITLDLLLLFWRSTELTTAQQIDGYVAWPLELRQRYDKSQRWDTEVFGFAVNQSMVYGIDLFNGYDPLNSERYFQFVQTLEGPRAWSGMYQPLHRSPLLRVTGVTHTLSFVHDPAAADRLSLVSQVGRWKLWQHLDAWPRVYLSRRVLRIPDGQQLPTLKRLAARPFARNGQPVVGEPHQLSDVTSRPLTAQDRILNWTRDLNSMTIQTSAAAPTVLVQSEAWYPGWRAWINDQPASLERANYLFRAVAIPAGETRVSVVYDTQTYRFGLFVSLCGLCAVVAMGASRAGRLKPRQ